MAELSEIEEKLCESSQDLLTPFSCHICSFRSPEKYSLQRHFHNKHSLIKGDVNLIFPCQLCNKQFKKKSYLLTHLATHPKLCVRPYLCSMCNATFAHIVQLERHHLSHEYDLTKDPNEVTFDDVHDPKRAKSELFHCAQCSLGFESVELLEKHKRRHIETVFTSPMSLSSSTTSAGSSSMMFKNEPLTFKSSSSKLPSTSNMNQGKKKTTKSKMGTSKNKQQQQPRKPMHIFKKVLNCPYCPSKFSNKSGMGITNLNIHLVIKHKDTLNATPHTDLNKCPQCVKLFTSNQSLNVHILKKHGVTANNNIRHTTTTTKKNTASNSNKKKTIKKNKGEVVGESSSNYSPDKKKSAMLTTSSTTNKALPRKKSKYLIRGDDGGGSSCSDNLSAKQTLERKSRFRKRLLKKRAQLSMKKRKNNNIDTSLSTSSSTMVKSENKLDTTISSSDDFDLASTTTAAHSQVSSSCYSVKRGRGRPPNNALHSSTFKRVGLSSSLLSSFKRTGPGRPPGTGKVMTGRIVKKYKCKHCNLSYIHFPSFITHQNLCSSATSSPPTTSSIVTNTSLMKQP